MQDSTAQAVKNQYEAWPYPYIPLLKTVRKEDLWQLNLKWMQKQAGVQFSTSRPRIWITGCGTFQPYVMALANPHAEIVATDISQRSLDLAQKRCRLYGTKNIHFVQLDLTDPSSFPQGQFDWIESYGVLMCLPDPQSTLQHLVERLVPHGILRAMVYPHFGRRRIFQIQRLAQLVGLTHKHPAHPRLLQKILTCLPQKHPLQYAFSTYFDAQHPVGIVDAFLHASDCGFTGLQWASLTHRAGLVPGFFLHRPWGQPHQVLSALGLEDTPLNLALHYLDVWQELRSNFIVGFKKANAAPCEGREKFVHPLFDWQNLGKDPLYRARLFKNALLGTKIASRTHEDRMKLSGKEVRALLGWRQDTSEAVKSILAPPKEEYEQLSWQTSFAPHEDYFDLPRPGKKVPNPFYGQLFDAWFFHRHIQKERHWPSLSEEVGRWQTAASPLEDERLSWGLTPHATYQVYVDDINQWLAGDPLQFPKASWSQVVLPNEDEKIAQVRQWSEAFPGLSIAQERSVWRELWVLLFSYQELFLSIEQS